MKKRDVINFGIILSLIIYMIFYLNIVVKSYLKFEYIITSFFIIILAFVSFLLLGYRFTKENNKRKNIRIIVIYEIVLYFFIYFGFGFLFGFNKNIYSMNIVKMLMNVFAPILIIISSELLRNIVIQSNKDKKLVIILITILLALFELVSYVNYYHIETTEGLFKMIACGLLPLIAKHSLLSYLTYHTGLKVSLIYRMVFGIYPYVVPIMPNYGEFITCLIEMIFPFIVFISASNIITKNEHVEKEVVVKKFGLTDAIVTVVFLVLISLVGGVFNHKLIAVASNSMNPEFCRGDSVLIEKLNEDMKLKNGDVISFDYNGRNTIHRIVSKENKDGKIFYHTKGDNNNAEDNFLVPVDNIYGKVLFKIPYVGYPSILVNEVRSELFGK